MATAQVFLTSGSSWTVPANFGSLVSVECIGGGSSGISTNTSALRSGGAGGAYAKITSTSTTLTPGVTSINVGIGAGGAAVTGTTTGNAGGDTWWNATSRANAVTNGSAVSCAAQGGQAASSSTGGLGGTAANSVGTTKFSGGNGFSASSHGAGGAGGPSGAGGNGSGTNGGNADNGVVTGPTLSANGNSGTEFDASHGCGTGALNLGVTSAFNGALYGGGGCSTNASTPSGAGANGLIVITYNIAAAGGVVNFPNLAMLGM